MSKLPIVQAPNCPHCGGVLDNVEKFSWGGTGGDAWQIICVLCPHPKCRKTLQFWIFPVAPQAPPETDGDPNPTQLWKPS